MDRPVKSKALLIQVEQRIFLIRGQNVMLSHDLAQLYGVETKALNAMPTVFRTTSCFNSRKTSGQT
jgi:hypothetical protein